MKKRGMLLLAAVMLIVLFAVPSAAATELEPQGSGGPLVSATTEGYVFFSSDSLCGSVNEPGGYSTGWDADAWVLVDENSGFNMVVFDSITFYLPEGFVFLDSGERTAEAAYIWDAYSYQPGGGQTPLFLAIYLPDAYSGKVYYMDVVFQGTAYTDGSMTNSYCFSQKLQIPFFRINEATTEAAYSSKLIGDGSITWDEAMITSDYNQNAAELGAVLSALAYDENAIHAFLKELGCYEVKTYSMDAGADINNIGYHVAKKRIMLDGKIQDIIFVAARGTTGWQEWIGNANVNIRPTHSSFWKCGCEIYNAANREHRNKDDSVADTFTFFTGHSRAAAAANIAGHMANSKGRNCVAYTFATPTVNQFIKTTSEGEHGIYNFVFYQDVIRNCPSMAQYGRYGSTRIFGYEVPVLDENAGPAGTWTDSYGIPHLTWNGFTDQEILNACMYDLTADSGLLFSIADLLKLAFQFEDSVGLPKYFIQNALNCHDMKVYLKAVRRDEPCGPLELIEQRTRDAVGAFMEIGKLSMEEYVMHNICCPVDVFVYGPDWSIAAGISRSEIFSFDENLIVYTMGDVKTILYPRALADGYSIRIMGYEDGEVTHAVVYFDENGPGEMVYKENIPIANYEYMDLESLPEAGGGYAQTTDVEFMDALIGSHMYVAGEDYLPFEDVYPEAWFFEPVWYVYFNDLMNGISDTEFAPDAAMNRAMLVTVLHRLAGKPEATAGHPFEDVGEGTYYAEAVAWAYEAGVVNGTSDITFSPEQNISREQIVTMFYRYARYIGCDVEKQSDLSGYEDAGKIAPYAVEAFRWAVANGIINGMTETTLGPTGSASRAQCAAIIQRFDSYCG